MLEERLRTHSVLSKIVLGTSTVAVLISPAWLADKRVHGAWAQTPYDRASESVGEPRVSTGSPREIPGKPWRSTRWVVQCVDGLQEAHFSASRPCAGEEEAARTLARNLTQASRWLEDLGFPEPDVRFESNPGYLKAFLIPSDRVVGNDLAGYFPGLRALFVKNEKRTLFEAPAHELFHAMQKQAYERGQRGRRFMSIPPWIREGTAEALNISWMQHGLRGHRYLTFPLRDYAESLHAPSKPFWNYSTANFWLFAGERAARQMRDLPGSLEKTMAKAAEAERSAVALAPLKWLFEGHDLTQGHGLAGVDTALQSLGGLAQVYVEFVRSELTDERYFSTGSWRHDLNREGRWKMKAPPLKPLAAHAHRITVSIPAGKEISLQVSLKEDRVAASAGGKDASLRLIVGDKRYDGYDASDPQRKLEVGVRENQFQSAWVGSLEAREFIVRVANAAPDAASTLPATYELDIAVDAQTAANESTKQPSQPTASGPAL